MLLRYLALTETPIKPGVAIIFSIALGLAFTNTIYALNRLRELRKKNGLLPVTRTLSSRRQSVPRRHPWRDDGILRFSLFLF